MLRPWPSLRRTGSFVSLLRIERRREQATLPTAFFGDGAVGPSSEKKNPSRLGCREGLRGESNAKGSTTEAWQKMLNEA